MGQKTRDAIAAFQRKTGMPVNGRIDTELLKTLKAIAV
jgi:peptidoglycan hydrolase-like protein with peptidoglycan-binding domain